MLILGTRACQKRVDLSGNRVLRLLDELIVAFHRAITSIPTGSPCVLVLKDLRNQKKGDYVPLGFSKSLGDQCDVPKVYDVIFADVSNGVPS